MPRLDEQQIEQQRSTPEALFKDRSHLPLVDTGTLLQEGTSDDGPGFGGASYDEVVPESGRLFLSFNDREQAFADSSAAFTLTIALNC